MNVMTWEVYSMVIMGVNMKINISRTLLNKQKGVEIIQSGVISSQIELDEIKSSIVISNSIELVIEDTRRCNES